MEQRDIRNPDELDTSRWVEDRLSTLNPSADWHPDSRRALALVRSKGERTHGKSRKWGWVAAGALATGISLMATPVTRAFAQRCVSACVSESGWIAHFLAGSSAVPSSTAYIKPEDRKTAPDFTLSDASSNPVTLSQYRGKVVLLNFWATWCAPCKREIPWFVEFTRRYAGNDFAVIGVSLDDSGWKSVRPFIDEQRVNYPIVIGNDTVAHLYDAVQSLPTTMIIDRSGRIAVVHAGLCQQSEYESDIQTVLSER